MKSKSLELTNAALDWAVYKAHRCSTAPLIIYEGNGRKWISTEGGFTFDYSNWAQGGPIIEHELIRIIEPSTRGGNWVARIRCGSSFDNFKWFEGFGQTALIAAMRCYVASKLGYFVDVPEELI